MAASSTAQDTRERILRTTLRLIGEHGIGGVSNRAIAAEARNHDHVYVLDYDALVARHGDANWHDERLWLTSRWFALACG